ncbi:alpha-L-rhamnosidase [Geobacillus thermocatenulatus]|uniref:alpha-L-rhamnosidase n=1 Tax=Geobacillus thermocatenulatus TaxID=33938 RepID=UPI00047421DB|nr:alpha-L-rhamnosidase [Geobacillus thermocatenulatus]
MDVLKVCDTKCEYKTNPLGIDVLRPRLSWVIESDQRGTVQQAYQIQVWTEERGEKMMVWDPGRVESDQSIHIEYAGPRLRSRTRYFYRVKVWDNFGRESDWSDTAWWETALLESAEWKARWITPDPNEIDPLAEPAFLLRKPFEVNKPIAAARVYATGVGLYELYLNGQRVGEDVLTPGWTSYHKRLQYQTYDVTSQLCEGINAIGVMLADGWYKGTLGWEGKRHIYGDRRAALVQLHVCYEDGTEKIIVTDSTWKAATGPILYSEIYHGEVYDARLEQPGWCEGKFDDSDWKPTVVLTDMPLNHLIAQENWPTRITETIRPIASFVTPAGEAVLDMGQNMVGRIRMTVSAPPGTTITLQHAEVLDKEGNFYTGNLRRAKQTVTYIAKGEGTETYAPHFTFQGFRYVKVEGYPGQEKGLPLDCFVGEVIHSDMEPTGHFECSHPLVNQLQQNIRWGQRGNFVDVPTDCPQRDERLGWTGDAQVFIRTALFNYQGAPFFTKWLRDLKADQFPDGGVPFVIPNILGAEGASSSAAWGDAAVICPWTVYLVYGDKRLLAEQYDSMKAWVEYIRRQGENEHLWNTGFHFGDWLALDAKENSYVGATPTDLIATAFYAYSTRLVRDAAVVLNKAEDVRTYTELLNRIKAAFQQEFITPSGRLASPTQTAHVLALMFDLVEGEAKKRIARELNEMVIENDYHLTTGFVGTPYLCFVLSENGYHDTAVRLLLQDTYPSWLYSVKKGATTIWEHWDSIKPDGSFWSDDMNSFNHYAYGAIGDWLYRVVAGLDLDESVPAYQRIRIHPRWSGLDLTYAKATYKSMYGWIESSWVLQENDIRIRIRIPANATARLILPEASAGEVREKGRTLDKTNGIQSVAETEYGVELVVGSGEYDFVYPNKRGFVLTFSEHTRFIDLLSHEETVNVLKQYAPEVLGLSMFGHLKMLTLRQIANVVSLPSHRLNMVIEQLNQLHLQQPSKIESSR